MNSVQNYNKMLKVILSVILISIGISPAFALSEQDQQVDLIVKGKVSKGTCSFAFSSKVVEFSKPLVSTEIGSLGDKNTPTEPFTISYNCQDYTDEVIPDLQVEIKSDGNSNTVNGKLYPKDNVTNAAFSLYQCDFSNTNCQLINFQNSADTVSFPVQNGENDKYFEARVVKLNELAINSGKLNASVVFTFVQP
ncbi:fimbrial protein [Providencia vermicola]|uniref:fimbrial protein n=1 Tax=Providencia vermicola TaxID=333965 RepID=UPI0032DB67D5